MFNQQFHAFITGENPHAQIANGGGSHHTATPWQQFVPSVWTRPTRSLRMVSPHMIPPSAFVANSMPSSTAGWFPNSGASYHVTSDANNLQQLTPFEGHDQIFTRNDQCLNIEFTGSNSFFSPCPPHTHLTLKNILPVPFITKNLMSVSKFSKDNNVYFLFNANKCLVKS